MFAQCETLERAESEPVETIIMLQKYKFVMVMESHSAKHFVRVFLVNKLNLSKRKMRKRKERKKKEEEEEKKIVKLN